MCDLKKRTRSQFQVVSRERFLGTDGLIYMLTFCDCSGIIDCFRLECCQCFHQLGTRNKYWFPISLNGGVGGRGGIVKVPQSVCQ